MHKVQTFSYNLQTKKFNFDLKTLIFIGSGLVSLITMYFTFQNELDTRFIKANIKRYINKEPIVIHKDKIMDFFYMKDFINVINYYINNERPPKEIDCTYEWSYHLYDIAQTINELDEHKVEIQCSSDFDNPYFGDKMPLEILKVKLIGLKDGIKEVYEKIINMY